MPNEIGSVGVGSSRYQIAVRKQDSGADGFLSGKEGHISLVRSVGQAEADEAVRD